MIRHDWTQAEVEALFALPFPELAFRAQTTHRAHFDANVIQLSTLCSIKTGGCPEDCGYCPQSAHFDTGVDATKLMAEEDVLRAATAARDAGATRFCMGAAWRSPKPRDVEKVVRLIHGVKRLGLETCATLGMLDDAQAQALKEAGLDYYNHNLDTSREFYPSVITTRTYQDRLDTLDAVRRAGIHVCCGGIVGMGESVADRAGLLRALATLPKHPESVPINLLVQVQGTKLAEDVAEPYLRVSALDFVRTVAVARLLMPRAMVRLSAGRETMSDEMQALCFLCGANSIFYGEALLTTGNPAAERDRALLAHLGMRVAALLPMEQHDAA